jgi:hypothetical protein
MESRTCPECTNEVDDDDAECTRCGATLGADVVPQPPPLMSVLSEAQPPAGPGMVIATRVMAVALGGWLCALAVFSCIAYRQGYVGTLLPVWNWIFVVGTLPVIAGIFARRMWAHRWAVGIATLTGLGHVIQANRNGSTLLWAGALLLAAVVIVLVIARPIFRHDSAHRGTLAQLLALTVTIGSALVYLTTVNSPGTERGRAAFVTELQQTYAKAGVTSVRVFIEGRSLVIEGKLDSDEQIDAVAQEMHVQLRKTGPNAKAWMLGFENIKLTNGTRTRFLAPADPP